MKALRALGDRSRGAGRCAVTMALAWLGATAISRSAGAAEVWPLQGPALTGLNLFGCSVSLAGDTLLVGASGADSAGGLGSVRGAAQFYIRTGLAWSKQGAALAPGAHSDTFGAHVAVSGNTAAIVAPGHAFPSGPKGALYIYVRSGTTWALEAGPIQRVGSTAGDQFGASLALDGDTVIVGALGPTASSGAAFVFARSGTTWTQQTFNGSNSLFVMNDGWAKQCATSVGVSGDFAFIGCPGSAGYGGSGPFDSGAVAAFQRTAGVWARLNSVFGTKHAMVGAQLSTSKEHFGQTLAVSGNTLLVGAPTAAGAAYPLLGTGASWAIQGGGIKGTADTDAFGSKVAISGDTLAVGSADSSGSARAFRRSGQAWAQVALFPNLGVTSLGVGPDTVVVGSSNSVSIFSDLCVTSADCGATGYCSSGKCITRCTGDAQCAAGTYCSADGPCVNQVEKGAACDEAAGKQCAEVACRVCATGSCADGVCCNTACDKECEACTASVTGDVDGTCSPVPIDQDPQNECVTDPSFPQSCGAPGVCDGNRHCRDAAKPGTACGDTTCASTTIVGKVCSGAGVCQNDSVPCAPYTCDVEGQVCASTCETNDDCEKSSSYCFNGTCVEQKTRGEGCASSAECRQSDFCVDGVCCESACGGQCQSCGESGSEGKCQSVVGSPRGEREPCSGDPEACGGACDGANPTECKYASPTKVCGQACADGAQTDGHCDGSGSCSGGRPMLCAPYQCGETACLQECADDNGCASGYTCADGACVPAAGSECSGDLATSLPTKGDPVLCAPYLCNTMTGSCKNECRTSTDCVKGAICNPSSQLCEPHSDDAAVDSGCGCRVGGAPQRSPHTLAFTLALALLALGGRRRRRLPTMRPSGHLG